MLLEGSCHCQAVRVEFQAGPRNKQFARDPDESIAQWRERLGLSA